MISSKLVSRLHAACQRVEYLQQDIADRKVKEHVATAKNELLAALREAEKERESS